MDEIRLTGSGLTGVKPAVIPRQIRKGLGAKGQVVKLGRLRPETPCRAPQLLSFLAPLEARPIPGRVDWSSKAARSLGQMYANDRMGCCVISGKAHVVGIWSAEDKDSKGEIVAGDDEIISQYQSICGPGDRGCYIASVLEHMVRKGLTLGGQSRKLDGYVSVDHRSIDQTKTAIHLFGSVTIGFNLPSAWSRSGIWDITNSGIIGGHDVPAVGYDSQGVYLSSWGRVYLMTWRAWTDPRYIEECYALLGPDWYNSDKLAPAGVNVEQMKAALAALAGGVTPPIPDEPVDPPPPIDPPVDPPPPPSPANQRYAVSGTITRDGPFGNSVFNGIALPMTDHEWADEIELNAPDHYIASTLSDLVERIDGLSVTVLANKLQIRRRDRAKADWSMIIAAIIAVLQALAPFLRTTAEEGAPDGATAPPEFGPEPDQVEEEDDVPEDV